MLTERTFKGLSRFFKISAGLERSPYEWDPTKRELKLTTKTRRTFVRYAIFAWEICFTISCANTFIQGYIHKNRKISSLAIDIMFFFGYGSFSLFELNLILYKKPFMNFVNCVLRMDQEYARKFSHLTPPLTSDGCDYFILLFNYLIFSSGFTFISVFLENPSNPRYFYHYLPGEKGIVTVALWSIVEYYILTNLAVIFDVFLYPMLIYTRSSNHWLRFLCRFSTPQNTRKDKVKDRFKMSRAQGLKMYKTLKILNVSFNYCYSKIFWPTMIGFNMYSHVMSNYMAIKFHGRISNVVYAIFPFLSVVWIVMEAMVYPLVGTINGLSRNFRNVCKENSFGKIAKRDTKAMSPLGIRVSSVYLIKKTTVLVIVLTIINFTVNFIIML